MTSCRRRAIPDVPNPPSIHPPIRLDADRARRRPLRVHDYPHANYHLATDGDVPSNHTLTILGNLLEEAFAGLIAPKQMRPFFEAVPACCAPCAMRETCQGGCKAAAQVCYGSLDAGEPFLHCNRVSDATHPTTNLPVSQFTNSPPEE